VGSFIIKGLMGEANLRCARGETDDAIKLCMEVIRQVQYFAIVFDIELAEILNE